MNDTEDQSLFEKMVAESSSGFLAGVIDSIQDGAAIYDAEDRLVYFNAAYTQYFTLVADILKPGVTFETIFRTLASRGLYDGPAEELDEWLELRLKLFRVGSIANEVRRNDGRWIRIDYYKLGNGGTFVVSADITARKLNEERLRNAKAELEDAVEKRTAELRASEARFRALLDNSPSYIYLKHTDGRYQLVNRHVEEALGLPAEEIVGKTHDAFYPEHLTKRYAAQDREVIETRKPVVIEIDVPRVDGPPRTSLLHKFPVFDDDGGVESIGAVIFDITERKQAEQQLRLAKDAAEQANVAKSQFLANMSHELRTPLNAVIGYSELLMETAEDEGWEEAISDLKNIQASGRHLLSLINSVLDLSKIEAGKMEVFTEEFEIGGLVSGLVQTVTPLAEASRNRLRVICDPGIGSMRSDITKVRQILFNLLSNATKFTDDGEISVSVSRRGSGREAVVEFAVSDTGIGIGPADQDRIFETFAQAEGTKAGTSGTGLGLAITRRFCELLGGGVSVTSEPGQGAVFSVVLPAALDASTGVSVGDLTALGGKVSPDGRPTVLVIDDDPAVRDLLSRRLDGQGYDVVSAADGATGLAQARAARPSAVILDILLPDMNGWDVLSAMQEEPDLASIPVIVVTITEDVNPDAASGAAARLTKPIDQETLLMLLRTYCR